jgi:hypothetical protein
MKRATARALGLALEGQLWFTTGEPVAFPYRPEDVTALGRAPGATSAAAMAASFGARAAVLAGDAAWLDGWAAALAEIDGGPETALRAALVDAWACLARGAPVAERARDLEADARIAEQSALVIEAAVIQVLDAARVGDLAEATRVARRASRMARTESLPQEEYLANVALARVRRLTGRAHLAARILNALLRVAPVPWHRWLCWELALSSGDGRGLPGSPESMVRSALRGDAAGLTTAADDARHPSFTSFRRDVQVLWALVDPSAPSLDALAPWITGATDGTPPEGLHGVCLAHPDRAFSEEPVWVVVHPDHPGRRVLSVALALSPEVVVLEPGSRRRGRTDAAIAALALRGPEPIAEQDLFLRLYGFSYQPRLHQGARDTLYYRVRERLGEAGELERSHGTVHIRFKLPLAIPDPRCAPPPEHGILAVLAEQGRLSVRAVAQMLGIPVRTAQHALKALAEEGICEVERRGRELQYRIEDTTFSEPTRTTQDV